MAKNTQKNPVENAELRPDGLPVDFDNWETEKLGEFPPYWNPVEGLSFYARPIGVDFRQEDFHRVIFEAMADTPCFRGPAEDAEEVTVKKGENFTCSLYSILGSQIGFLISLYSIIPNRGMVLKAVKKVASNSDPKRKFWTFELVMHPDDRKALKVLRTQAAGELLDAAKKVHKGELVDKTPENAVQAS